MIFGNLDFFGNLFFNPVLFPDIYHEFFGLK